MVGHPKNCQHCQKRPVKNLKTVSIRNTFIASFGQTLFMLKSCSRCNKASSSSISSFSFSQEIGSSFELVEASWLEARTATACDPMRHAALFMTLVLRSASMVVTCALLWLMPASHTAAAGKEVKDCRRKLQSAGTCARVQTNRALVATSLSWLLRAEPTL